jgi:hypothetical protein
MQQRPADGAEGSHRAIVDERTGGSFAARLVAIWTCITRPFRGGPHFGVPHTASPPEPPVTSNPPLMYLAAAPTSPTTPSPLFDTRFASEVRRLVGTLGASRESVAAALEAAGVRAVRKDWQRSPVVLYLGAVIGADPDVKTVKVAPDAVVVDLRAWWRPVVTVPLPEAVRAFSIAFDAGCYPTLVCDEFKPDGIVSDGDAERTE